MVGYARAPACLYSEPLSPFDPPTPLPCASARSLLVSVDAVRTFSVSSALSPNFCVRSFRCMYTNACMHYWCICGIVSASTQIDLRVDRGVCFSFFVTRTELSSSSALVPSEYSCSCIGRPETKDEARRRRRRLSCFKRFRFVLFCFSSRASAFPPYLAGVSDSGKLSSTPATGAGA